MSKKRREEERLYDYGKDLPKDDLYDSKDQDVLGTPTTETDNSRWELDSHPVVVKVMRILRRERQDANGRWGRPSGVKPMVNDIGVFDISSFLNAFLDKDIALGNIDKQEAHKQAQMVTDALIDMIMYNHKKWELHKSYFSEIIRIVDSKAYFHFTRPVGDKERVHRAKKYGYSENYSHDEVRPDEIGGVKI